LFAGITFPAFCQSVSSERDGLSRDEVDFAWRAFGFRRNSHDANYNVSIPALIWRQAEAQRSTPLARETPEIGFMPPELPSLVPQRGEALPSYATIYSEAYRLTQPMSALGPGSGGLEEAAAWIAGVSVWVARVYPGGDWDFKRRARGPWRIPTENYSNFVYGLTGTVVGFSPETLLIAGGVVAQLRGSQTPPGITGLAQQLMRPGEVFPGDEYSAHGVAARSGGIWAPAHGDDERDAAYVMMGIEYARSAAIRADTVARLLPPDSPEAQMQARRDTLRASAEVEAAGRAADLREQRNQILRAQAARTEAERRVREDREARAREERERQRQQREAGERAERLRNDERARIEAERVQIDRARPEPRLEGGDGKGDRIILDFSDEPMTVTD
jgi:hypothetical protein